MDILKFVYICLVFLALSKCADAAVGANCTVNTDCNEPSEACDVDGTGLCVCAADYVNDPCVYDCGEPPSETGYSAIKDGTTVEGETATVTCDTGNGWSGSPPVISCVVGGWEALSGCVQSGGGGGDCGPPTNPTGYTLTADSGTSEGDSATVACATGFTEDSGTPAAVTCSGGSWESPSGCSPVECGSPAAPTNGAVQEPATGTHYGQQATYSCDSGYTLSGSAQVRCQADSSWETAPTCVVGGNGASEIRQTFSFFILTGSLIITLMYV